MNDIAEIKYVLGHSPREIERLVKQAVILRPITARLLQSAGIKPGMRVLDLGCGAGDVAMLAAEAVGPSGSVIGIDRNEQVVLIARERAQRANFEQLKFKAASIGTFRDCEPFDLVIGRYLLMHQADPVKIIRTAADLTHQKGTVAFHEINIPKGAWSSPNVPLWQELAERMRQTFVPQAPHWDAGARLTELFSRAGLPNPKLFSETPIGNGENSDLIDWMVSTFQSIVGDGLGKRELMAETVTPEALVSRLTVAIAEGNSQIEWWPQICAWARVGGS
jgi:ubiquinone/menaquinone biosynthesis C-methylase UbiE